MSASYLHPHLGDDDVLTLLNRATGFSSEGATVEVPTQGVNNRTYLVREAGLAVKLRPAGSGGGSPTVPCPHWPAYVCALLGDVPNGGVRSLVDVTRVLRTHGGLAVPNLLHHGEGTGPEGADFTIGEILPGRPFDWTTNALGRTAARQLGDHLGRLHDATVRTDGFGIFGGETVRWTRWWPRFAASYTILADDVGGASPVLRGARARLDAPLRRAVRSPDPRAFSLVCVDQNPTRYLSDDAGRITGFVDVEGHLWAPAEWELSTILLWMPHSNAFRNAYERHRSWPEGMDAAQDAYTLYTLMEWLVRTRDRMDSPAEVANLEALIFERLPSG